MVVEGLKLMVLGMGVVGIFLAVLVVAISLSAKLLKGATERELAAARQAGKGGKQRRPAPAKAAPTAPAQAAPTARTDQGDEEKRRLVAVMAAALAAHRAARQH